MLQVVVFERGGQQVGAARESLRELMMPVPASRVNTLASTSPLAPRTHTEAPALPHEPPEVASSVREDPECLRWGGNARQKAVVGVVEVAAAGGWCVPLAYQWTNVEEGSGVSSPPSTVLLFYITAGCAFVWSR